MTWADGFAAYLRSYEVRVHRRLDTWGGKVWADSTPMRRAPATVLGYSGTTTQKGSPRPAEHRSEAKPIEKGST